MTAIIVRPHDFTEKPSDNQPVIIEAPLENEPPKKAHMFQMLIKLGMGCLMAYMMYQQFASGARSGSSSMMGLNRLLQPIMIIASLGGMMMVGGGEEFEVFLESVKDWISKLSDSRDAIFAKQSAIHDWISGYYPNPLAISSLIKQAEIGNKTMMWRVRANTPDQVYKPGEIAPRKDDTSFNHLIPKIIVNDTTELTFNPFLAGRIGTGHVRLSPGIQYEGIPPIHNIEPLTAYHFHRFVKLQSSLPNVPLALSFADKPITAFIAGDDNHEVANDYRYALIRSVILSLCYNHPPNILKIGFIGPEEKAPLWDWLKWLPHIHSNYVTSSKAPKRYTWKTLTSFADTIDELPSKTANSENIYYVIFVDINTDAQLPTAISLTNYPHVKLVFVHFHRLMLPMDKKNVFTVTSGKTLQNDKGRDLAIIDTSIDITTATKTAKQFAKFTTVPDDDEEEITPIAENVEMAGETKKDFLDALGLNELSVESISKKWAENLGKTRWDFFAGFRFHNKNPQQLTKIPVYINLQESIYGGIGPHGCLGGQTGSGKSFLLRGMILSACAVLAPECFSFISCDFKAGGTFKGLDKLPHCVASLSNLAKGKDALRRFVDVVIGESEKRQKFLDEFTEQEQRRIYQETGKWRSITAFEMNDYHMWCRKHGEIPKIPYLLIVFDEFGELMESTEEENKRIANEVKEMICSIHRVGRSLKMSILAGTQTIEKSQFTPAKGGATDEQMTFGMTLKVDSKKPKALANVEMCLGDRSMGSYINDLNSGEFYLKADFKKPKYPIDLATVVDFKNEIMRSGPNGSWIPTGEKIIKCKFPHIEMDLYVERKKKTSIMESAQTIVKETPKPETKKTLLFDDYSLFNPVEIIEDEEVEIVEEVEEKIIDGVTQRDALMEAIIATGKHHKKYNIWLEKMSTPIPMPRFARKDITKGAVIEFGVVDYPFRHRKDPLVHDFSYGSLVFYGGAKAGKTYTLLSMMMAANQQYLASEMTFAVIDYAGLGLLPAENLANVCAYATKNDRDAELINRIVSEALSTMQKREQIMSENKLDTVSKYIAWKRDNPDKTDDPYGHLVIVIDGFTAFAEEWKMVLKPKLVDILRSGKDVGVHMIAADFLTVPFHYSFAQKLFMKHGADISLPKFDEGQELVKSIGDTPGMLIAANPVDESPKPKYAYLYARTFLPQFDMPIRADYDPTKPVEDENPETFQYAQIADYSEGVKNSIAEVSGKDNSIKPSIDTCSRLIPYRPLVSKYIDYYASCGGKFNSRTGNPEKIWVGGSERSLLTGFEVEPPFFLILGEAGSGKTSFLRGLAYGVLQQYTSEDAIVFIVDSRNFGLLDVANTFKKKGMLGGYAYNEETCAQLGKFVQEYTQERQAKDPGAVTSRSELLSSIDYGKEVFIFFDNLYGLDKGATGGHVADFVNVVKNVGDKGGVNIFAARSDVGFGMTKETLGGLYIAMRQAGGYSCAILSGARGEGTLFNDLGGNPKDGSVGIKFEKCEIPGRGKYVYRSHADYMEIQLAYEDEWEEIIDMPAGIVTEFDRWKEENAGKIGSSNTNKASSSTSSWTPNKTASTSGYGTETKSELKSLGIKHQSLNTENLKDSIDLSGLDDL